MSEDVVSSPPPPPKRNRLQDDRSGVTHRFQIGDTPGHVTVGCYPDGTPGEIFVSFAKSGSRERGLLDAWATMVSISLQSGIPLRNIVDKFKHWQFEPSGMTRSAEIPFCQSPIDYICKWLELRYLQCGCEGSAECTCEGVAGPPLIDDV